MNFLSFISTAVIAAPFALGLDWTVQVGLNNGFTFTPNEIRPAIGDTVTFHYLSRNHTATTTTFVNPCPPPPGGVGPSAFDSGFIDAVTVPGSTFTTTIVDAEPHWVSCMQAAGAHCRLGMTLAINPPDDQTEAEFMRNAMTSP